MALRNSDGPPAVRRPSRSALIHLRTRLTGCAMATDFDLIEYLVVRRFPFANALRGPPSLLSMAGGNAYADRQSGLPEIETYKEELRNKRPAELQKLYDEELAKEAAEQIALAESEEQSRFFNQPYAKADVGHWSKTAYWTLDEAIALSLGKAPEQVTSETTKPFVDVSPFAHQYWRRRDLALRAAASKQLSDSDVARPLFGVGQANRSRRAVRTRSRGHGARYPDCRLEDVLRRPEKK